MNRGSPPIAVDVAIVNWNTAEAALAAAAAFAASERVEPRVTIVDNASRPEQRRLLRESCPEGVRLLLGEENLGYGAAVNQGLRDGGTELVCASNADVLPEPEALAELVGVIAGRPDAGMVGPAFGGETDRYHAKLPGPGALLGRIPVGSFAHRAVSAPAPGRLKEIDQPSGACFAISRDTWERMSGFDESFFLWYEDVDLAKRLREAGFHNLLCGSARVGHSGATAFAQVDRRRRETIRLASIERYIEKHHPGLRPLAAPLLGISRRLRGDGASAASPPA